MSQSVDTESPWVSQTFLGEFAERVLMNSHFGSIAVGRDRQQLAKSSLSLRAAVGQMQREHNEIMERVARLHKQGDDRLQPPPASPLNECLLRLKDSFKVGKVDAPGIGIKLLSSVPNRFNLWPH